MSKLANEGDRVHYVIANPRSDLYWCRFIGTITRLYKNGGMEFTPDPGQRLNRTVSLASRRFQVPREPDDRYRFKGQYGLTLA